MDLNQHPQPSPGKKILHQSPMEEAEFWVLEPETGGDWEDVVKGHHDLLTLSLSRAGKGYRHLRAEQGKLFAHHGILILRDSGPA